MDFFLGSSTHIPTQTVIGEKAKNFRFVSTDIFRRIYSVKKKSNSEMSHYLTMLNRAVIVIIWLILNLLFLNEILKMLGKIYLSIY